MPWAAGRASVFARGEDDAVGARFHVDGREWPALGVGGVVGEGEIGERDGFGAGVVEFDPVAAVAVFVADAVLVGGEEFGEDDWGSGGGKGCEGQCRRGGGAEWKRLPWGASHGIMVSCPR